MTSSLKRNFAYASGVLLAVLMAWVFVKIFPFPPEKVRSHTSSTNLPQGPRSAPEDIDNLKSGRTPDVIVVTKKFTSLWRDILKTSFIKKIVNEDILFYYEESESYLSLKGAVKRIAFERNESMADEILSYILDRPMQLAYWKSFNGRLDQYMGITKRSGITDLVTALAKVALPDKQLHLAGKKEVDGVEVEVYQLDYTSKDTVYFYALKDELVFFSSWHSPLPSKEVRKNFFREESSEVKDSDTHTLFVSTQYLSFGYQFFTTGLDSVRFSFSDTSGWATAVNNGQALGTETVLDAVPVYPAFCSFVPFNLERVSKIFALSEELKKNISQEIGVCWYENSKIYSPLVVFKTKEPVPAEAFKGLFEEVVGTFEKGILTAEEKELRERQIDLLNAGEKVDDFVRATKFVRPFAVEVSSVKDSWTLSREISSPYGFYAAKDSKNAEDMRSKKFFNVTLARYKNMMLFSADDKLVEKAISTLKKNYPNAKETMKNGSIPLFVFDPARFASLLKETALESLPEGEEALFRESLMNRLFPALKNLADQKPILGSLSIEQQKNVWSEMEWHTYSSR